MIGSDLYIAGPPCVQFSHLGLRAGEPSAADSTIEQSVLYIEQMRPIGFILENVVGLMTFAGGSFFDGLVERLNCGGLLHDPVPSLQFAGL